MKSVFVHSGKSENRDSASVSLVPLTFRSPGRVESSLFVHPNSALAGSPGLADTLTADQVVGNRLKMERTVTVFIGHPGSSRTETWNTGFVSPPVFSWVEEPDGLYWMIGELQPIRYVKHDQDSLDIVPDSGGAQFLKTTKDSFLNMFDFELDEFNIGKNELIAVGLIAGGAIIVLPLTAFLIRKALTDDDDE